MYWNLLRKKPATVLWLLSRSYRVSSLLWTLMEPERLLVSVSGLQWAEEEGDSQILTHTDTQARCGTSPLFLPPTQLPAVWCTSLSEWSFLFLCPLFLEMPSPFPVSYTSLFFSPLFMIGQGHRNVMTPNSRHTRLECNEYSFQRVHSFYDILLSPALSLSISLGSFSL